MKSALPLGVLEYGDRCFAEENLQPWDGAELRPFEEGYELIGRIILPDSGSIGIGNVRALRLDDRGNAVILDSPNRNIKILRLSDGIVTSVFGRPGRGPGEFRAPFDASIAPTGHILVADAELMRVSVFTEEGGFIEQFQLSGQDPRLLFARSDSAFTVIGEKFDGRRERMVVRYVGESPGEGQLQMDPLVRQIDLIVDAPWASGDDAMLFTGMVVRPVITRLQRDSATVCRFVSPPDWKQLDADADRERTLQGTRTWIESASIIDGAAYSRELGLVLSYSASTESGETTNLITLGEDLAARTAWRDIPGRLLAAAHDSLIVLGEPVGQQLPLLIYRRLGAK